MDKAFAKAQPPKMMYVVPNDTNTVTNTHSSVATPSRHDDGDLEGTHDLSNMDDLNLSESYGDLPPAPPSRNSAHHVSEAPKAWPQTDFIKKHILDNSKLQSLNGSPARITAPRSRSTTPNSVRKTSSSSNNMYGMDLYDVEEKTAALEAIQALRAARAGTSDDPYSPYKTSSNTTYNATTPSIKPAVNNANGKNNNYSSLPSGSPVKPTYGSFSAESSPAKNNNTLTELAAADLPYHNADPNSSTGNYSTIPATSNHNYDHATNGHYEQNYDSSGNSKSSGGVSAELVQQMADQRVLHMIESDPAVQKVSSFRYEHYNNLFKSVQIPPFLTWHLFWLCTNVPYRLLITFFLYTLFCS